jgi:hypothetical protein
VYTECAIVPADGRESAPGERVEGSLLIADMRSSNS